MDRPADGLNSLSRCRTIAVACSLNDRSRLDHGGNNRWCRLNRRAAASRAGGRGLSLLAVSVASFAASMTKSLGVRTNQGQNHGKNHNSHHASSMTREPPGAGAESSRLSGHPKMFALIRSRISVFCVGVNPGYVFKIKSALSSADPLAGVRFKSAIWRRRWSRASRNVLRSSAFISIVIFTADSND